ncbi:MAG: DUF3618 domain-containing protein [Myxococcota bacterium]
MKYETYTSGEHLDRNPAEIRSDLEAIRAEMSETLRQLEEKLSPREAVDQLYRRLRAMGGGSTQFIENLGATVRDHPVPVLLLAAGTASLIAADRAGPAAGGGTVGPSVGDVSEGASEAAEAAGAGARRAAGAAWEMGGRARHTAHEARVRATGLLQEQPLVIVGLGLAAGAMLGAALPPAREAARKAAREMGEEGPLPQAESAE